VGYYMAGDYYMAGGFLGDIFRKAISVAKVIPGIGGVAGAIEGVLYPGTQQPAIIRTPTGTPPMRGMGGPLPTLEPVPGIKGGLERLVPGGATGYEIVLPAKKRRMNIANPKALRRAIRREQGFVKLAKRALKGTGHMVVTKGSRAPRRDLGRGHTHVR